MTWSFQWTRTFCALMVMPALPFDVHRVEVLLAHIAGVDGAGQLQDPVGERGLAVVDVGHDGEVADAGLVSHVFRRGGGVGCAAAGNAAAR